MELARPELALSCPGLAHLVLRRAQCAEGPAAWAGGARSRCAFRSGSRGASAGAEDLSGATADRPADRGIRLAGSGLRSGRPALAAGGGCGGAGCELPIRGRPEAFELGPWAWTERRRSTCELPAREEGRQALREAGLPRRAAPQGRTWPRGLTLGCLPWPRPKRLA